MTGGEKITARMLYKAEIEYRPEFKIMMGTNVRPKITGSDDGIWRRVKMIPFTAQIPANKIDRRLGDKLREEKSGILNWAIAGAIGWYNEGLPPCAAVDYANEEYRKDMDRMQQFVEDCLTRTPGNSLQAMVLYGVYRRWCEQNGERVSLSTNQIFNGVAGSLRIPQAEKRPLQRVHGRRLYGGRAAVLPSFPRLPPPLMETMPAWRISPELSPSIEKR